jgi:hypothetical protein
VIAPPPKPNKVASFALGVVLIVVIAAGLIYIAILIYGAAHSLFVTPKSAAWVGKIWSALSAWLSQNAVPVSTVLIAIATVLLWRATATLARASEAQLAASAPFLSINFVVDEQPSLAGTAINPAYISDWSTQDAGQPNLGAFLAGGASRYVRMVIENKQSSPHGVAASIRVDIVLCWGGKDSDQVRPHTMARSIFAGALAAGEKVTGPVLNVGTLPAFKVLVADVRYVDIGRRNRRAAYAKGFDLLSTGFMNPIAVVIEPERGEIGTWQSGKRGKP